MMTYEQWQRERQRVRDFRHALWELRREWRKLPPYRFAAWLADGLARLIDSKEHDDAR